MINREIIRIKIVQLTYAYYQNGNKNIDTAEKELFFSLSKAYDLYNYLLSLITAVTKEAQRRLEVAQARAKREGTEEPSPKFVYNRFALQLAENKQLNDFLSTQKLSWDDSDVFIGQLFEKIEQSDIYQEYMNNAEDNYELDRELWRKLYKTFIQTNEDLESILEDQSLYWNDDKEIVDTFVIKTIKRFNEQEGAKQELLPEWDSEEEKDFARKLFRSAILNADEY
ncbi:MAG: transcription antitermination factor NusB, partial [Prevotella sp.]|nr:transcription antitermination factor NusB [Prevotella sp.]